MEVTVSPTQKKDRQKLMKKTGMEVSSSKMFISPNWSIVDRYFTPVFFLEKFINVLDKSIKVT